jgi:membrane protein YdbS with pleckstrin-like domain
MARVQVESGGFLLTSALRGSKLFMARHRFSSMEESVQDPGTASKTVILVTNPDPRSFLPRYLLAFTPLLLAGISFIITAALYGFLNAFVPNLSGSMGTFLPGMGDMIDMAVLLTAPVSIFLLVVIIGWMLRFTEMWTSSALALGLSSLGGIFLVIFFPVTSMSRIMDLLTTMADLILPASAVAVIIVIAWTEKFRRSISYAVTNQGVVTKGGVWTRQEQVLPYNQIGRLVMEQGPIMRLLHTGTVIPVATGGPGGGASRDTANAAKAGQGASRHPLDCLYGVRDPEKVMALLEQLIPHPAGRGEEKVSNLRKIYEKL